MAGARTTTPYRVTIIVQHAAPMPFWGAVAYGQAIGPFAPLATSGVAGSAAEAIEQVQARFTEVMSELGQTFENPRWSILTAPEGY